MFRHLLTVLLPICLCNLCLGQTVYKLSYDRSGNRSSLVKTGTKPTLPVISGQDQNIVIINNESVRLTYKVENTPNSKYAWNIINGQINEGNGKNEINVTWFGNPSGYGQLSLVETSIDGCMSDTAMYSVSLDIITSVQPHLSSERLLVFPNPSKNRLHIEYELKEVSNVVIDVINSSGNVVQTLNNGNLIPGKYSDIITNNLSKGIYILILDTKKNILVTKFAIED